MSFFFYLDSPGARFANATVLGGRTVHGGTLAWLRLHGAVEGGGVWRSHVQLQEHDVLSLETGKQERVRRDEGNKN